MSKIRRSRTYNTRLIKRAATYTLDEIAGVFSVHINSVRQWMASGLSPIDFKRPILVHGSVLFKYLNQKQASRKRSCSPSQFYCFTCREPRLPLDNLAFIENQNEYIIRLRAICEQCGTKLNKAGSQAKLAEYTKIFSVQQLEPPHIGKRDDPVDNCDFKKEKIS
jgi:hypothetical protein